MSKFFTLPLFVITLLPVSAGAQLPFVESFKTASATGVVISGVARLTAGQTVSYPLGAGTITDPATDGYLRLTDATANQVGCIYSRNSFPASYGITATFDFFMYKAGGGLGNQADGITFYLFDASVNAFRAGANGGGLGYAQRNNAPSGTGTINMPGVAKGYIGIGLDEFGSFSKNNEGKVGGISSGIAPSVIIRGTGDGFSPTTDYPYIAGVQTDVAPHTSSFLGFAVRYPDSSSVNYRRLKVILMPGSSAGSNVGYKVTVIISKGAGIANTAVVPDTIINAQDYPYVAPANMMFGIAASTGNRNSIHEIRNMRIEPTNTTALAAPVLQSDAITICQNSQGLLDITANDASQNSGGSINKGTIDLDPTTPGQQLTYTDPGKGVYTADAATGLVTFAPVSSYTGASSVSYNVADNYGKVAAAAAAITVTVTSGTALAMTVADPPGACSPATVNITGASVITSSSPGTAFSYFSTLANATANTANISTTSAAALGTSGTYYIRGDLGGCSLVQPVNVVVSQTPTTAVAGNAQSLCGPATNATLVANAPAIGTGAWSVVSGPAGGVAVSIPTSSSTQVKSTLAGSYTLRWSISNGACPVSTSDLSYTVYAAPTTANAGTAQAISGTSTTLTGNTPATGTGLWTKTAGGAATITTPTSPVTTVTGLTAGSYTFRWTITNVICSSTSDVNVVTTGVPLPLRLLSFTGRLSGKDALLYWNTASETGCDHFEPERSADGISFEPVGRVKAKNSTTGASYAFTDQNAPAGSDGAVYYRLKETDVDGSMIRSQTIRLYRAGIASASVQPAPFGDAFTLTMNAAAAGSGDLYLYDMTGRIVHRAMLNLTAGNNVMVIEGLSALTPGVYLLSVQAGGISLRQRVVKQ